MKKNILLMIVTAIIFTGIGVFATIGYQADEIGYGTGTVKDAIDDLYDKVNAASNSPSGLLWTNETPDAVFADQTISLDLSGYDFVFVKFQNRNDAVDSKHKYTEYQVLNIDNTQSAIKMISTKASGDQYNLTRNVTVSSTGVTFSGGSVGGHPSLSISKICIPLEIYGLKDISNTGE